MREPAIVIGAGPAGLAAAVMLRRHGGQAAAPGVWFTGFRNPISGALRELRSEAVAIARAVSERSRC